MSSLPGHWLLFAALIALSGCGHDKRHEAEKTLRQVGPDNLRHEAAAFYKELFVAPTGQYSLPKSDQWPPTFSRFSPLQVRAYTDGFSLPLEVERDGERGLYVVPQGMDHIPTESDHAHFRKISDGIYWYHFAH